MEPVATSELFEEDPELAIEEQDDGSVLVAMPDEDTSSEDDTVFSANLAESMDKSVRHSMAADLIDLIDKDKDSRRRRQEQYEEGLRRTGLGDDAPGGAQFQGASRVVHPVLAEACVDFEARAIKELMPSNGPVKTQVLSDADPERLELANVKRDILNLQMTKLIPEWRDELESLLSQLPMGGSQYQKIWWDGKRKRTEFLPIDHVFLPLNITNFYSSPRVTHRQLITRLEFEARCDSGLYLAEAKELSEPAGNTHADSPAEAANDKIQGQEQGDIYNEDGLREVYEVYLDIDMTTYDDAMDEGALPYIAHIDVHTSELVGLYRNWEEEDADCTKLHWIVDWGFIPWRGAYKLGLPHLIGGLSAAATGALRALLDSAHAANAPTLMKLKSGRLVGQTTEVAITQLQEIEGPTGIDDIRKLVSAIPFPGPNATLFSLLGFIVDAAKGVVTTAEEKIAEAGSTMPVGTSMALIEQGSKVFSSIHARLHASQARALEILCRLNAKYPETGLWSRLLGKQISDGLFSTTDDISPVSDPNIFSEAQRYSQLQTVMQLSTADPTIQYNRAEIHRRMLQLINLPDIDSVLPEQKRPQKIDAVQENMAAVAGVPLKSYPDQDHMAHMEVHLRFLLNPAFGANPLMNGQQLMVILQHCNDHLMMIYPQLIAQGQAMALATNKLLPDSSPDRQYAVGAALADANAGALKDILKMIQMAQQVIMPKMPKPPMDPQVQATLEVAKLEDARAKEKNAADAKLKETDQQSRIQRDAAMFEAEQRRTEHAQQMEQLRLRMEDRVTQLSQQVELMKNDADNKQHQMTELLKNRDDNQTQIIIAQIKAELDSMRQSDAAVTKEKPKQDDSMLKEMQRLLGELKDAKTNNALESVVAGLQAVITGQQKHQENMLNVASQLMRSE